MIYRCNHKYDNGKKCSTPHVTEDEIKDGFVRAVNMLHDDRDEVLKNAKLIKATVDVTDRLGQERAEVLQEMEIVAGLIEKCISENSPGRPRTRKPTKNATRSSLIDMKRPDPRAKI